MKIAILISALYMYYYYYCIIIIIMDKVVPKELQNTKQFGKKIIKTEFGDRVVDF